jgi:hypothetical protein
MKKHGKPEQTRHFPDAKTNIQEPYCEPRSYTPPSNRFVEPRVLTDNHDKPALRPFPSKDEPLHCCHEAEESWCQGRGPLEAFAVDAWSCPPSYNLTRLSASGSMNNKKFTHFTKIMGENIRSRSHSLQALQFVPTDSQRGSTSVVPFHSCG